MQNFLIILFAILSFPLCSQSYDGGEGQGYASATLMGQPLVYEGGSEDGYTMAIWYGNPNFYNGGTDDGYVMIDLPGSPTFYAGGSDDGYNLVFLAGSPIHYAGGENDGYEIVTYYVPFTWTGAVGTGWNVPENWNSNVVPNHHRPTIIPASVTNYPAVNVGLFSIGEKYYQADYYSGELLIRPGAQLLTRLNCEVFLHGYAKVSGAWYVRNLTPGSFLNQGELEIGGSLIFIDE